MTRNRVKISSPQDADEMTDDQSYATAWLAIFSWCVVNGMPDDPLCENGPELIAQWITDLKAKIQP